MNKKLIIGIITGVVVIGALFTTFLIKNSSKNSQTLENTTTNNETTEVIEESDENTDTATQGSKVLVVYFSIPETDNPNNMTTEEANSTHVVDGQVLGNTQYVANLIQAQTKSDIYRIETAIDYPTEHRVLVDQAQQEQRSNARPELKNINTNIADYDVIFIGYPNWWGDLPMPLYSFLEQYDLSGKTIIPFNTHGGSGLSNTVATIASLQPNARVEQNAFTLSRTNMEAAPTQVEAWLRELGY